MSTSNSYDLRPLKGEAAPTNAHEQSVLALGNRLDKLVADYDRAEEKYVHASKLCYNGEFKAVLANDQLSHEECEALMLRQEAKSNLNDEISEEADSAYQAVLAFIDELLDLNSTTPAVLALKARACLWERSIKSMRDEGFVRVAEFMAQLAAI